MAVKRWLVTVKATGDVLSVVWADWWFGAREKAEQVHRTRFTRDEMMVDECPLLPEEHGREHPYSAAQLAPLLGKKVHVDVIVTKVDHATGVITAKPVPAPPKKKAVRKWKKKAKRSRRS